VAQEGRGFATGPARDGSLPLAALRPVRPGHDSLADRRAKPRKGNNGRDSGMVHLHETSHRKKTFLDL
jgi:hypothetical protein